jgi:LPXTG-motif cell wall-anchored protein
LLASEKQAGILYLDFPKQSIQTLYTLWGDGAILGIGLASFVFFLFPKRKKKLP